MRRNRGTSALTVAALLTSSLVWLGAAPAAAFDHFNVDTTDDTVDANPGDGICADINGNCSLRAAIMEANAGPGGQTIVMPAGTYTLTLIGTHENDAATGDLDITHLVQLQNLTRTSGESTQHAGL